MTSQERDAVIAYLEQAGKNITIELVDAAEYLDALRKWRNAEKALEEATR